MCNHFLHDQRYPHARKGCRTGKVDPCADGSGVGPGLARLGSSSRCRRFRACGQPARSSRSLTASHATGESAERPGPGRDNASHQTGALGHAAQG